MLRKHIGGAEVIAPLPLNLKTTWRQVVKFMPWQLHSWERNPVPTKQETKWAHSQAESLEEENIPCPYQD